MESPSIGILIVAASDVTCSLLYDLFDDPQWSVYRAHTCFEASTLLDRHAIQVAISETRLHDGSWLDLLFMIIRSSRSTSLVVTSPFADEALWAEVLNLGGYDVLAQPFDRHEVTRVAQAACRRCLSTR